MTKVTKAAAPQATRKYSSAFPKLATFAALVMLAGCIEANDAESLGSDPDYSAGYNDGCATANSRVQGFDETVTRNNELFNSSEAYRSGWRSGHATCGSQGQKRDKDVWGGEDRWYGSGTIGSPK